MNVQRKNSLCYENLRFVDMLLENNEINDFYNHDYVNSGFKNLLFFTAEQG